MAERLFELLFKYRPHLFAQGEIAVDESRSLSVAAALALAAGTATVLTYRTIRLRGMSRDRALLIGLRLGLLAVLLGCLVRPVLILKAAVPQQNFVGVLVDDSRSMQIADRPGGRTRADFVRQQVGDGSGTLIQALSERFMVRTFRFSRATERLTDTEDLGFQGPETYVAQALGRVTGELAGLPLAGLVVVTDGADTSGAAVDEAIRALKAQAVPVFAVGVGSEAFDRDIQVMRVDAPRRVLKGTSLAVDVVLSYSGLGGSVVPVQVEDEGRLVGSQDVTLALGGRTVTARVRVEASRAGPRIYRFRVPPQPGEVVAENNVREVLIDVVDRKERILYYEGEPRWEMKFIRRAVEDDSNLALVVLQRTAENKYLRFLDRDDPDMLAAGFPKTREELFGYRGLILGSIEASAFTPEQIRMIADFVGVRGGGLLMIGGRRAFGEGGYAGTPIDEVLPVVLDGRPTEGDKGFFAELSVRQTPAGAGHVVTQIGKDEKDSAARWKAQEKVSTVNQVSRLKPGATVLLIGSGAVGRDQIVLAHQRYGRGKALALPVQDSWSWQLGATVAVEDMTHETFWRRLLRWLVDGVPDKVEPGLSKERVERGETLRVTARVVDDTYTEVNDARVTAEITAPSGAVATIPLTWDVKRNGEYQASFAPAEEGLHLVRVEAARGDRALGENTVRLRAGPSDNEFFDQTMNRPLLERLARETGGRFYTEAAIETLAEDINYTGRGVTIVEQRDLWDMPAVLVVLVALMAGEWTLRRSQGLV